MQSRIRTLTTDRDPIAIGWNARKRWTELDDQARTKHTFLENFKLALHDPQRAGTLPMWLTAEQVRGKQAARCAVIISDRSVRRLQATI